MDTMIESIEDLTTMWVMAKKEEQEANRERLSIEARILELCQKEIKVKGTTNLPTGIKVVTGFTEKWDQDRITSLVDVWPVDVVWPFEIQYKPVNSLIENVRSHASNAYNLFLQEALTISPSKPSFSYVEKK